MWNDPPRYTPPEPFVAFHATARVGASGCVADRMLTAAIAAARWLRLKRRLKIIKAPLNAMGECRVEVDAVAEVANQIRDGKSAGVLQHAAHGHGARRVGELCLSARELS